MLQPGVSGALFKVKVMLAWHAAVLSHATFKKKKNVRACTWHKITDKAYNVLSLTAFSLFHLAFLVKTAQGNVLSHCLHPPQLLHTSFTLYIILLPLCLPSILFLFLYFLTLLPSSFTCHLSEPGVWLKRIMATAGDMSKELCNGWLTGANHFIDFLHLWGWQCLLASKDGENDLNGNYTPVCLWELWDKIYFF